MEQSEQRLENPPGHGSPPNRCGSAPFSRLLPCLFTSVALLSLACSAAAQPPKLVIPPEVRPAGQYVTLLPDTDAVSVLYVGSDGIDPFPSAFLSDKRAFLLDAYGKPAGRYRFAAVGASKTGEQARVDFVVIIGNPPTPPVPPGPNPPVPPGPEPPGPTPPTPPAPIPTEGFRVLFLLESADLTKVPPAQLAAMDGLETVKYLDSHCAKEGGTRNWPEWRRWDKDIDLTNATPLWQSAKTQALADIAKYKGGKPLYPWLVVSNGKAGYSGPMPETQAELLKLLKVYGGE